MPAIPTDAWTTSIFGCPCGGVVVHAANGPLRVCTKECPERLRRIAEDDARTLAWLREFGPCGGQDA